MASGNGKLIDQLKLVRSSAEAHVSQKVNKLNELMAECENIEALNEVREELQQVLQEFQVAHEAYHGLIKTESEQEESSRYYNSVLEIVSELEQEITSWLNKPALQTSVTPINVRPRTVLSGLLGFLVLVFCPCKLQYWQNLSIAIPFIFPPCGSQTFLVFDFRSLS